MARAICNGDKDPIVVEQALVIAENQLILNCVRAERIAIIERLRDRSVSPLSPDNSLQRAKIRFRMAQLEYQRRLKAGATAANSGQNGKRKSGPEAEEKGKNNVKANVEKTAEDMRRKPAPKSEAIGQRNEFDAMRLAMPDLTHWTVMSTVRGQGANAPSSASWKRNREALVATTNERTTHDLAT